MQTVGNGPEIDRSTEQEGAIRFLLPCSLEITSAGYMSGEWVRCTPPEPVPHVRQLTFQSPAARQTRDHHVSRWRFHIIRLNSTFFKHLRFAAVHVASSNS
ncbi:hypothetical protein FI667_g2689, partial [Globisporangium splendens]